MSKRTQWIMLAVLTFCLSAFCWTNAESIDTIDHFYIGFFSGALAVSSVAALSVCCSWSAGSVVPEAGSNCLPTTDHLDPLVLTAAELRSAQLLLKAQRAQEERNRSETSFAHAVSCLPEVLSKKLDEARKDPDWQMAFVSAPSECDQETGRRLSAYLSGKEYDEDGLSRRPEWKYHGYSGGRALSGCNIHSLDITSDLSADELLTEDLRRILSVVRNCSGSKGYRILVREERHGGAVGGVSRYLAVAW